MKIFGTSSFFSVYASFLVTALKTALFRPLVPTSVVIGVSEEENSSIYISKE